MAGILASVPYRPGTFPGQRDRSYANFHEKA
jgi:hypothetical protein